MQRDVLFKAIFIIFTIPTERALKKIVLPPTLTKLTQPVQASLSCLLHLSMLMLSQAFQVHDREGGMTSKQFLQSVIFPASCNEIIDNLCREMRVLRQRINSRATGQ